MAVSKTRRAFSAAAAIAGVGAAGLMMAAPANADVTKIGVNTPAGYGSASGVYGASCTYEIEATVSTNASPVSWYINDDPEPVKTDTPSNLSATYDFTPEEPGTYVIKAEQAGGPAQSTTLNVAPGINIDPGLDTGSLNIISPFPVGCIVLSTPTLPDNS
ncbi:hypothetical protein ACIGKQ_00195 [Gordonia sp. NPDC062954]|uniref:hypothetical protein n=1 Tax=Gordonia sp. NPDC062954 TaxID=3364003 RepID=UPI0037C9D5D1